MKTKPQFASVLFAICTLAQAQPSQLEYRRTLYWNPNLKLDENGEATITFYNNSRTTYLSVEAEGQATDGTLLWGKTE